MKIILLCLFLNLSAVSSFCLAQGATAKTQAQVLDPYTFDFGKVREGEISSHVFALRNDSGKNLDIKDINTSCGCTVSKIDNKHLKPGESALIEIRFDSKGYSGAVQQFVYVTTNSLDKPVIRYIIKVEVGK